MPKARHNTKRGGKSTSAHLTPMIQGLISRGNRFRDAVDGQDLRLDSRAGGHSPGWKTRSFCRWPRSSSRERAFTSFSVPVLATGGPSATSS